MFVLAGLAGLERLAASFLLLGACLLYLALAEGPVCGQGACAR